MNKQEIENKLKEFCSKEIKENYNLRLDIDNLESVAKQAFNFALELAAENTNINYGEEFDDYTIDKQSILDLKL